MGSLNDEENVGVIEEKESNEAIIYINGVRKDIPDGLAHLTLLEYLRGSSLISLSLFCFFQSYLCLLLISFFFFLIIFCGFVKFWIVSWVNFVECICL